MIVSDRAVEIAKSVPHRGYVLDLVEWADRAAKDQTPMTVADLTLRCLIARLEEMLAEGPARFARHRALTAMQHAWARSRGLSLLARPGFESASLSAISVPKGVTGPLLARAARKHLNADISPGYGPTADGYVRIAAMGTTSEAQMRRLLDGLSLLLDHWADVAPTLA
jgi:aspartate aminotransferase-like enzyme